jgi:hypothetical protein
LRELGQALEEGVETLSGPGAKEAQEIHARVRACRAARAATELACNDQRAHRAFGQIIVRWDLGSGHKDEPFR